jgi:hypothetical protein
MLDARHWNLEGNRFDPSDFHALPLSTSRLRFDQRPV